VARVEIAGDDGDQLFVAALFDQPFEVLTSLD